MYFNPVAVPFIVSGIIMLYIAKKSWSYRSVKGTRYFALLNISCAIYAIFYAMEISSANLDTILFWISIEYIGIAFSPTFLILFALAFVGKINKLPKATVPALLIFSFITLIIFQTNDLHFLFYQETALNTEGPFPIIDFERGPWYWVHSLYIITCFLLTNILLMQMWLSTHPEHRKQITIILISSLLPWLGFFYYLFRPIDWNIDINPLSLSLSAIIIFWSLFKHDLFKLIPVARTRLFEELPDGVMVLDTTQRIIDLNPTAQEILGIEGPVIGKPASSAIEKWPKLVKMIKPAIKEFYLVLPMVKAGKTCWFKVNFIPLEEEGSNPYGQMIIFRDITEAKLIEDKLYNLTITDELTGLYNRRYFIQILNEELSRAERYGQVFSLIMFDIDSFKDINDTYGHTAGDEVLRKLGIMLKERLRKNDTAARIGGEEFGLIIPETNLDNAYMLAETLRKKIASEPVVYEDNEIYYTISLGVTTYTDDNTIEDLLKAADKALYEAKEKGRNRTVKK